MHGPRYEQDGVTLAKSEHGGGQEHDDQADHHGNVITNPVDQSPREGVDAKLDDGFGGEEDTDGPSLIPVRHRRWREFRGLGGTQSGGGVVPALASYGTVAVQGAEGYCCRAGGGGCGHVGIEFWHRFVHGPEEVGNDGHDDHVQHVVEEQRDADDDEDETTLGDGVLDPVLEPVP